MSSPSLAADAGPHHEAPGSGRVLTMSTIAFTLMFAVWLMFGILGKPIQKEFHLTPVRMIRGSRARRPQRLDVAPAGRHAGRPHRRPQGDDVPARDGLDRVVPRLARLQLPHAARAGLPRRLRRKLVQRRHRLELGLVHPHRQGFALGLFGAGNVERVGERSSSARCSSPRPPARRTRSASRADGGSSLSSTRCCSRSWRC